MCISLLGVSACDSEPPSLMKASKQFDSAAEREQHIAYMRKNHMDALKHKRDETMYQGIRTKRHSLNACIDCHVPVTYKGEVLRHTNPEHFCTTCHSYVAAKLDCFECHVDHPVQTEVAELELKKTKVQTKQAQITESTNNQAPFAQLGLPTPSEMHTNAQAKKPQKGGGVPITSKAHSQASVFTALGVPNE